ncbi:MAG TPA: glycosyltransferase [Verrucomicrobiae bacterium]|nr:glycosyltransferase [Verrucomicrobiae bacterium]
MKVSGFTFVRNGHKLGYPFVESIRSILPIVDEFVVALGPSDDGTGESLHAMNEPKLRIVPTQWNERIRNDYSIKGYVYGQQKSIALFNCTGDWAFYLEGDEVVHENDLPKIQASMQRHLNDERVEALYFDYLHFYGNKNTYAWSPAWYRTAPRILRNTIPAWAPKGLFFLVMQDHKRGRYPRAAHADATIYHYGWVRNEAQMNLKAEAVHRYWRNKNHKIRYEEIDPLTLRQFKREHPKAVQPWLEPADGVFTANPNHRLTRREKKHRIMLKLESWFGFTFKKTHYSVVR